MELGLMTNTRTRSFSYVSLLAVLALCTASNPAVADPAAIIISTPPDSDMVSLGDIAKDAESANGVVDILLLENTQEAGGKFKHFLAVTFRNDAHRQAWAAELDTVEADAVNVRFADVLTHGEVWPRETKTAVFKVNDYDPIVSSQTYDAFADGYIRPLMEGQVSADIMSRYTMFYEHGIGGNVWSAYEYVSQEALDNAGEIKAEIRATLSEHDASYRDYHPKKDTLRVGGGDTLAVAVPRQ